MLKLKNWLVLGAIGAIALSSTVVSAAENGRITFGGAIVHSVYALSINAQDRAFSLLDHEGNQAQYQRATLEANQVGLSQASGSHKVLAQSNQPVFVNILYK